MTTRKLGATGLNVSAIGLGASPLGALSLPDADAEALVHAAIDLGVTTIDTAPSYGASEERLGRALKGKRERVVLMTKGGYGVPGEPDWSPRCIALGIDRALERLATDHLDVFLLHSCGLERLAQGDLFEPLHRAKQAGKLRAVGYSGDGDALSWAVRCGGFDVVECSVNLFDRSALSGAIPEATARGVGVIAKRALANAVWRFDERPAQPDFATYWDRMRALPSPESETWLDLALRFAAFAPGVDCALVGTTRAAHLAHCIGLLGAGPLSSAPAHAIDRAYSERARDWPGVI
jgi:aryl-alcohol dehydrogenase-like predicted oxidoreductase